MHHRSNAHEWDVPSDYKGTTYRDCADRGCRGHQQWICALDRWSDTSETRSPLEREEQRVAERGPRPGS